MMSFSGVATSFIDANDEMNSQPQKRRKRGRPSNKKNTEGVTESSIELSVNTNASDNSAAVVKQGICSTPVMRISPGRRRSSSSTGSSNGTLSTNSTPRKSSKKVLATPKELSTINEYKSIDTKSSLNKAHFELANVTHGNHISEPQTYKFSASPLSSISSRSTNSSPFVDASSSPLKTSPVSTTAVSASLKHLGSISILNKRNTIDNSLDAQEDHASVDQLLLHSSPVVESQQSDHSRDAPDSTTDSSNSLLISSQSAPKTPTTKMTNTFLSPNKFSSFENSRLQPPSTPTSNFSSIMNSSPMYTLWYHQTPKAVAPPVTKKNSNKKKRQLVSMPVVTATANLVPMPVNIEDIISTPRGGLKIVDKKEEFSEKEGDKKKKITNDVKHKAEKLDSIVAKIHEKFPKLNDEKENESNSDKKVVKNISETSSARTTPSPSENPQRLKKQSSRVNLLNLYRQQNSEIASSPSTNSVSPTLSQGLSSALLPSNYEISVKIGADGKAKIVTQRRKRPTVLHTPGAYHLMNGFNNSSNVAPSTPIMKQEQIHQQSQSQSHSPYYHYHPAFPCHMEVKQSSRNAIGLGVTNHEDYRLMGLNTNVMMTGVDMRVSNTTGLGLLKTADNIPGIKIGAGTDPFVTGISSNFNEFENPILIAQSPSTPFINQYGQQQGRNQYMAHNFVINTPGSGVGIGVLGSPRDIKYDLMEKRNFNSETHKQHNEKDANDYDDMKTKDDERLTKEADQQQLQNFKCDARFALQALLEEI